jgi:hypothetical protein
MKCKCGFKFSKPGEFRNCDAFIDKRGRGGIICPKCNKAYIDYKEVKLDKEK